VNIVILEYSIIICSKTCSIKYGARLGKIIQNLKMCILSFLPWCDLSVDANIDATVNGDVGVDIGVDVDPIEVDGHLDIEPIGNSFLRRSH
jgi:hypothetical protein